MAFDITGLSATEHELIIGAEKNHGKYFLHARDCVVLCHDFIESIDPSNFVFVMYFNLIIKHLYLALLSTIRRHHLQAMMDLRQFYEAAVKAAFSLAENDENKFIKKNGKGAAYEVDGLKMHARRWLEKEFPLANNTLHDSKKLIDEAWAHANIVYAGQNFRLGDKAFKFSHFDELSPKYINAALWFVAYSAYEFMDIIYGVNQRHGRLKFQANFLENMGRLRTVNQQLRVEAMENFRYGGNQLQ